MQRLNPYITYEMCEISNEENDCKAKPIFTIENDVLFTSDTDPELLIFVHFNVPVNILGIKLKAPEKNGPKMLKLFKMTGPHERISFDNAKRGVAHQAITYVFI